MSDTQLEEDLRALRHDHTPLDIHHLWWRGRVRRRRRIVLASLLSMSVLALVGWGGASLFANTKPSHSGVDRVAAGAPAACRADSLSGIATWGPSGTEGLVLTGTVRITNDGNDTCRFEPNMFSFVDEASDLPILSTSNGGEDVPIDSLTTTTAAIVAPNGTVQATLRWGGSYCGPPLQEAGLRLSWSEDQRMTIAISGPVLRCINSVYYDRGQSSGAISPFRSS